MSAGSPLEGASPLLATPLTLRFLLELALLAGASVAAYRLAPDGWRWVFAVAAVLAVAVVWALLLSPKATIAVPEIAKLALEAVLFLAAGAGLAATGSVAPAVILVVLWAADRAAIALLSAG